jgi:hypothetical protein
MAKYYTYLYFDPSREEEPFYVGKGSHSLCGDRAVYHCKARIGKSPWNKGLKVVHNV